MRTRGALAVALLAVLVASTSLVGVAAGADRDGDGLSDRFERRGGVTSPHRWDSDRDGVLDAAEDNDNDRLSNHGEQRFGTHPGKADTDRDGVPDGDEDHDRDGRSNALQQDRRPLPAGLVPSLAAAPTDFGSVTDGCDSELGWTALVICRFGPANARSQVVLMGDSHAKVLVDPFQRAARADGWRLVTMLKGGCMPVPTLMNRGQYELDGGYSCREWRRKAMRAIRSSRPDLVVITASQNYKLLEHDGHVIPRYRHGPQWDRGLRRFIREMPEGTEVLILGDVPRNEGQPVPCLLANPTDMSRCTPRRVPKAERLVEVAQRAVARAKDQHFGTFYSQICPYDPCPMVQGRALIWRDRSHLTGTFARRLTPAVRKMLRPYLDR